VNVQLRITQAQSEVAQLLAQTTTDMFQQIMNLLIILANTSLQNDEFVQLLLTQKAKLTQSTFNPTSLGNFTSPFNLNDGVNQLLEQSQASLIAANNGLQQQANINTQLNGLNHQLEQLAGERGANLIAIHDSIVAVQAMIYDLLNITTPDSFGSITDVLTSIGTEAAHVAVEAAHAGATFLDDILGFIPGSGIGGFIAQLIKIAFYLLVIFLVYKLLTSDFVKEQCRKSKKRINKQGQDEDTEEEAEEEGKQKKVDTHNKQQQQQQQPTGHRVIIQRITGGGGTIAGRRTAYHQLSTRDTDDDEL